MKPSEVLKKAADILRERGWTQGNMTNDRGCCCVTAAICIAAGMDISEWHSKDFDEWVNESTTLFAEALPYRVGLSESSPVWKIVRWNDSDLRTQDDVISTLERVSAQLEGGGR